MWIIMPIIDAWEMTQLALKDCLAQEGVEPRVLVIDNGSNDATRYFLEAQCALSEGRILSWHHTPPLPSLSATWNLALDFCWELGEKVVLVANNDIRLPPYLLSLLLDAQLQTGGWLVSASNIRDVGKPLEECKPGMDWGERGGPDFSCFLLSKEGHQKYRFDEEFTPAWHEDNDFHRRMILGGDGGRIFSVLVPYLHHGSQTIKQDNPALRARLHKGFEASRERYVKKWGGPPHYEKYLVPFGPEEHEGVGTPGGYVRGLP